MTSSMINQKFFHARRTSYNSSKYSLRFVPKDPLMVKKDKMISNKINVFLQIYIILCLIPSIVDGNQFGSRSTTAFEFPSLPTFFSPRTSSSSPALKFNIAEKKKQLISTISNTNNGKLATVETQREVLKLVREIEKSDPPPADLFSSPELAQQLDGVWYLQYTSPSELEDEGENKAGDDSNEEVLDSWSPLNASEGDSKIPTARFNAKGSISAQGFTVDTSNKPVLQIIGVSNNEIRNEVTFDFGKIVAGGNFRQSDSVPNRAIVAFTFASIEFNFGFKIKLDAFFALLKKIRGTADNGWLETTFLSDDMRIGRGNKGTLFVLTRNFDDVQP